MGGGVVRIRISHREVFFLFFLFEVVAREGYLPSEHPELWYASMWFA